MGFIQSMLRNRLVADSIPEHITLLFLALFTNFPFSELLISLRAPEFSKPPFLNSPFVLNKETPQLPSESHAHTKIYKNINKLQIKLGKGCC